MNNYPNFKNFNNYTNPSINTMNMYNMQDTTYKSQYIMPDYNTNDKDNSLYDAYNGFIRGNMFKNLYDPYKIKVPYDVKPMNEQAELLTSIDALGFAMIDLDLYLDIYPNDNTMLNTFNQYREQKENLIKEYENKYGPITLNSASLKSYPWAWDDMPWPWDN